MKRKLLLLFGLCCLLTSAAATYPSTVYIKSAWDGSNWKWKEMTTTSDGIYTYAAIWNNLSGCNINTSASDSGSAWFKKTKILGYDPEVITNGSDVILTYVAACQRLYVALDAQPSVYLVLSEAEIYAGDTVDLSLFSYNVDDPVYSCSVLAPGASEAVAVNGSYTFDAIGDYLFTAAVCSDGSLETAASVEMSVSVAQRVEPTPCPFSPTDEEYARCYHEDAETHDITFLYSPGVWGKSLSSIINIYVSGSFNGWSSTADDNFKMTLDPDRGIYYLTVPYKTVKKPGNSGQPEYKMVVNGSYASVYGAYPSDYIFKNADNNMIVVFSFDDFDRIKANSSEANKVKSVDDFDLNTLEGREAISNFRKVPGTNRLFRCYHPFKTSRTYSTEPVRMATLTELAVENGIKSDICLSGDDTAGLSSYTVDGVKYQETIPDYYQSMLDAGNVLYVGAATKTPQYNEVYYNSTSSTFGQWIKEVVDFINDPANPAPFSIHCRLGTDRTGVFCAILACLCDASWDEITADYQLTNRMGIKEFRDYHLLQYSIEQLLGVEYIADVENVSTAVKNYFIDNGYLTADDIAAAAVKLKSAHDGIAPDGIAPDATPYTVNGRSITAATPLVITTIDGRVIAAGLTRYTFPASGLYIVTAAGRSYKVAIN